MFIKKPSGTSITSRSLFFHSISFFAFFELRRMCFSFYLFFFIYIYNRFSFYLALHSSNSSLEGYIHGVLASIYTYSEKMYVDLFGCVIQWPISVNRKPNPYFITKLHTWPNYEGLLPSATTIFPFLFVSYFFILFFSVSFLVEIKTIFLFFSFAMVGHM